MEEVDTDILWQADAMSTYLSRVKLKSCGLCDLQSDTSSQT